MRKSILDGIQANIDQRVSGPATNILQPKRVHKSEKNIHIPAVCSRQTDKILMMSGTATASLRAIKDGHTSPLKYFHQGQVGPTLRTEV